MRMMKTLKATEQALSDMMDALRDNVFPDYADTPAALSASRIGSLLTDLAGEDIAQAFLAALPELTRLLHTDMEAI